MYLPRYKDENGWTPMHLAAYWNKGECLRLFIAHAHRHGVEAHNAANRYKQFIQDILRLNSNHSVISKKPTRIEITGAATPPSSAPPLRTSW